MMVNEYDKRKKERRWQMRRLVTEKVTEMMRMSADCGVEWGGSKADLLEMLQIAYVYGDLHTADGRLLRMSEMVQHTFGVFGLSVMKNVSAHAHRAMERKGKRAKSVADRVMDVLDDRVGEELLWGRLMVRNKEN